MTAARRSALIVPVSAAEPHVGEFRRAHDPAAQAGVPAHVTLIVPFLPAERLSRITRTALAGMFAATPGFVFSLDRVARFPSTLYLAPHPSGPFIELTKMLMRAWPEAPPYGGAFTEIVPHLTVAQGDGAGSAAIASTLEAALPIQSQAREVWLMLENSSGRWWRDQVYRLG